MLSGSPMFRWFAGVGAAISIKLSSSIDDVVWLAPFLTDHANMAIVLKHATVYITVCLVQTILAMTIAYSGSFVIDWLTQGAENVWTTDKILTVIAAAILVVYALKLAHEYVEEWRGEGASTDAAGEPPETPQTPQSASDGSSAFEGDAFADSGCFCGAKQWRAGSPTCGSSCSTTTGEGAADGPELRESLVGKAPTSLTEDTHRGGDDLEGAVLTDERQQAKQNSRTRALFVIAFIGSLDDLTLFVPMLAGKGFDAVQLVLGGFVAASAIVLLCVFLGLCRPIADCLSRVPLCLIVAVFAVILVVKAFLMD